MTIENRQFIEQVVRERLAHPTIESVRTTGSLARAERIIQREYHGRFLIELLQNAADAWRNSSAEERSAGDKPLAIVLTDNPPALLVANHGSPLEARTVIESLGHIGASTKHEGQAIGHKGIGFKSVLEITLTPEIYSRNPDGSTALAVQFDPYRALESIEKEQPRWREWVGKLNGLNPDDPIAAIPVLRFPYWVEIPHPHVQELLERGFSTVIRLPYDHRSEHRLQLNKSSWTASVRNALNDVSDQVLLLLGTFSNVLIEDAFGGTREEIQPKTIQLICNDNPTCSRKLVEVSRNNKLSSQWWFYRRSLAGLESLAGEIAVGIRLACHEMDKTEIVPALEGNPSTPFHLFFPTRIASGLPFLLHGYFEVDAARTGFYRGSQVANEEKLDELSSLTAYAINELTANRLIDLVKLLNHIASAGQPDDPLARSFRAKVLDSLNLTPWVAISSTSAPLVGAPPSKVFVARRELIAAINSAFPEHYIRTRTNLELPHEAISDEALHLIDSALARPAGTTLWDFLFQLCTPGLISVWNEEEIDQRFRAFLDLLTVLFGEDRPQTEKLLERLRCSGESCLLPVIADQGGRSLLPINDPSEGVVGNRSRLVVARIKTNASDLPQVPPPELDLSFLPDGLLASEGEIERAKPLGIRPFIVNNIIDRLRGIGPNIPNRGALLTFIWQLLHREKLGEYSNKNSMERVQAQAGKLSLWFIERTGRNADEDRRRRERDLARLPVPCRDGKWRSADAVAFGKDWAEWLEAGSAGNPQTAQIARRIEAYQVLEDLTLSPDSLLAKPETVMSYLTFGGLEEAETDEEEKSSQDREILRNFERLAFLLRLGIWEILPVDSFQNREKRAERFPWTDRIAASQISRIKLSGGWKFGLDGWSGNAHTESNVHLAEDYRLSWPLDALTKRAPNTLLRALHLGHEHYRNLLYSRVFCPGCSDSGGNHKAPRHSAADEYPSYLAVQLQELAWIPCSVDGMTEELPVQPAKVWWHPKPPVGAGLRQSPFRLLRLTSPANGMSDELRRLSRISTLEEADFPALQELLSDFSHQFLQPDSPLAASLRNSSYRQAFISLHRLAYERLGDLVRERLVDVDDALAGCGILCERGDRLEYHSPSDAFHDDGRYSSYLKYFNGKLPLVVISREATWVAEALGVRKLSMKFDRRIVKNERDVTLELSSMLFDRTAELLAIMVNHSLGTKTMEVGSDDFERRARKLQTLSIRQVDDLVIDASIDGTNLRQPIGEGSEQDVFLEIQGNHPPIIFHDFTGEGWKERLRKRIAPHLASLLENSAYSATFALFLMTDSDLEREEFLIELGITPDDVSVIASKLGIISEEDKIWHQRWFLSLLALKGVDTPAVNLDPNTLETCLVEAGYSKVTAALLCEAGGDEHSRYDTRENAPLRLLSSDGINLQELHTELLHRGDPGLAIRIARENLASWSSRYGTLCAAALTHARLLPEETAKDWRNQLIRPPAFLYTLDPKLDWVLAPVADLFTNQGRPVTGEELAESPEETLQRIGGFPDIDSLRQKAKLLYAPEEKARILSELVGLWRRELRDFAILIQTTPTDLRSTIKVRAEEVDRLLPQNPHKPSELCPSLPGLFAEHTDFASELESAINHSEEATSFPEGSFFLKTAERHGISTANLENVRRILAAPRLERAKELRHRAEQLRSQKISPKIPQGLVPPPQSSPSNSRDPKPKKVVTMKVSASLAKHNKHLGDEGEKWALAAVIDCIVKCDKQERLSAIDQILTLLSNFEGPPVESAKSHAGMLRSADLDDDEFIEELTGLLHVSRHSDAFGFDMVGWLPKSNTEGAKPEAICLEVKSSSGENFHLSKGEWKTAETLKNSYAVLVVCRNPKGGPPQKMELLLDPVSLHARGMLKLEVDGYEALYRLKS